MEKSIDSFSSFHSLDSLDSKKPILKRSLDGKSENNDKSEHDEKRLKPRRKFHQLDCECIECIKRYS